MIRLEYKRLVKSKETVLIVLCLLVFYIISFFVSVSDKMMFVGQMASDSPDLNKVALMDLIDHYTGAEFVSNFWFVSDFFNVFVIMIFLWIGVFLSVSLLSQKETGAGNIILVRTSYKKYLNSVLVSQTLYIFTVICGSGLLAFLVSMLMGGAWKGIRLGGIEISLVQTILMLCVQTLFVAVYLALVNGICLLSNAWVKSKYVIQLMPVCLFALFPLIVSSTIGNLIKPIGLFLVHFLPFQKLRSIDYIFNDNFSFSSIAVSLIPIVSFSLLLAVMYVLNVKKHRVSYL